MPAPACLSLQLKQVDATPRLPSSSCSTRPLHPCCRLGYFASEEATARAYDVVAAWRNRHVAAQLAARGRAAPRRARSEASTGDAQARKRSPSQLLPLNLPEHAPPADDPRLRASLEELLASLRGKWLGWQGVLAACVGWQMKSCHPRCGPAGVLREHCPTFPGA